MNAASQNLPRHLAVLCERMLHPTDYEQAVNYFFEEFAGDEKFVTQSMPDDAPHLVAVLQHVVGKTVGQSVTFDAARVFRLPDQRFYHGSGAVAGRVVLFFYFQEVNTGVLALIPGKDAAMEVARFRLPTGLGDPRNN